jgi:hypothetical protein
MRKESYVMNMAIFDQKTIKIVDELMDQMIDNIRKYKASLNIINTDDNGLEDIDVLF